MEMSIKEFLHSHRDTCKQAKSWLSKFQTADEAWEQCENSTWMLWVAKRLSLFSKRQYVELAIAFAEHVVDRFELTHPTDKRPRQAIEAAQNWLKNPTNAAADAAYAADAAHAAATEKKWQAQKIRELCENPFSNTNNK